MAEQKGYVHPLPKHVWEITVQVDNGDWFYKRTPVPMPFDIAVRTALVFEEIVLGAGRPARLDRQRRPSPDLAPRPLGSS